MTTTKEELVNNIKNWLALENEIKVLQKEIKQRREKRKGLTEALVEIMKTNEIDCFDISEGKLIYTKNKTKAPLSKKHLLASLSIFFKNDPRMVNELSKHIMETRQEREKENIKRKIKK